MKSAADVLKTKADQAVCTLTPADTVFDAVKLMADKNIGALLVFEGSGLAGMITERDYARKIALMSRSSTETPVREIMTSAVMYVRPDQTSEECMALMTDEPGPPPAGHGQRQVARRDLDRRSGLEHHLRTEVHHRAARALHIRGPRLICNYDPDRYGFLQGDGHG